MRFIGDDGQYQRILIKLNKVDGIELRRLIKEQQRRKIDYSELFKSRDCDAKSWWRLEMRNIYHSETSKI